MRLRRHGRERLRRGSRVWTGTSLSGLTSVACNDDGIDLESQVGFEATGGTTYLFHVGGFDDDSGSLTFAPRANASGRYTVGLPTGTYKVFFSDWCDDSQDYLPEWFDDQGH
jgi:hypothetical protein